MQQTRKKQMQHFRGEDEELNQFQSSVRNVNDDWSRKQKSFL
jgi:hypothetical protein